MSIEVLTQGGGTGGETASIFVTGLSETDVVTFTSPKGRVKSGKWVNRTRLPEEYQEVEYIKSNGTQHTDLGLCPNLPVKIEATLTPTDLSGDNTLFSANGINFELNFMSTQIQFGMFGSWIGDGISPLTVGTKYDIFAYFANGEQWLEINGERVWSGNKTGTYDTSKNLSLFYYDNGSSGDKRYFDGQHEVYKVYENGVLVRHLIPCYIKSTSEAGLYDLVSQTFFGNDGTGEFAVGANVSYEGFLFDKVDEYGLWTVTATNGEKTTVQDVLVDAAIEYEIEMSYRLYLYREGDECEDITGGWGTNGYSSSSHTLGAATKNTDSFYFNGESFVIRMLGTLSAVDFTEYTKLKAEVNNVSQQESSTKPIRIAIQSTKKREDTWLAEIGNATLGAQTYEVDVSNMNQVAYVVAYVGKNVNTSGYVYKIWLE